MSRLFFCLFFGSRVIISPIMENEYLTKMELMARLKVSRTIIDKFMRQGLPYIKLERRVLFKREDVDAFLESKTIRKAKTR